MLNSKNFLIPEAIAESSEEIRDKWYEREHKYCKNELAAGLFIMSLVSAMFYFLDTSKSSSFVPAETTYALVHRFGIACTGLLVFSFIKLSGRPFGKKSFVLYKSLVISVFLLAVYMQLKYSYDYPDRLRIYTPFYVAILVHIARIGPRISGLTFLVQTIFWFHFTISNENMMLDLNIQAFGAVFTALLTYRIKSEATLMIAEHMALKAEIKKTAHKMSRFLSQDTVDMITSGDIKINMKPTRSEVVIFYVDIVGFTKLMEEYGDDVVIKVVNKYLSTCTNTIFENNGVVDKFIGDAVMGIFGGIGSTSLEVEAMKSYNCAIKLLKNIDLLNEELRRQSLPKITVRIGMHSGNALLGVFGNEKRSDYTAMGQTVNLASRVESAAEPSNAFVSEDMAKLIPDELLEPMGTFVLRGIGKRKLYRLKNDIYNYSNVREFKKVE